MTQETLRDEIAQIIRQMRPATERADRILAKLRNPNLDNCPRYSAGEYSRRNIEAFVDDALGSPISSDTGGIE